MSIHGEHPVGSSAKRIPRVIAALGSQGSSYRVIEAQSREAEQIADWLETHFPIVGVQIEWERVSSRRCIEWSDTLGLTRAFTTLVRDLPGNPPVVVTWSDALLPSLEIALSELVKVAEVIFESSFDTWIVCKSENWCIEVHHEGTICFGYGRPG